MTDTCDVRIFDTTLRDGEQAPGFSMRTDEKIRMARKLDDLGVDIIEAGFPIASEADADSVRQVATEVRRPVIAALARTSAADIECAARALEPAERPRIHTFLATSDLHLERKLRMTREACLEAATDAIRLARRFTDDVEFSAEDATRSDPDFLCRVVESIIDAGATTVNLPDTVGYSTPDEIEAFFRSIIARVPNAHRAVFSTHCHDDLGLAVANSLAAVRGGVRQIECTVNGIGERAGNASLEEIIMLSLVRADRAGFRTNVVPRHIYSASQLLTEVTGEAVQANKAVVGRNAFAHEAGIHQDGVLKDRRTYEIMRPEDVGVPRTTLVLGKHSGRHAVAQKCEELGFVLTRQQLDRVYREMVTLADAQKHVSDEDMSSIASSVTNVDVARSMQARRDEMLASSRQAPKRAQKKAGGVAEPGAAMSEIGYGHGV